MTRKLRVEQPTDLTLRAFLFPLTTEESADGDGYELTEVEDRMYEFTISQATLVGTYRVSIQLESEAITTTIDSGYVYLGAADGTYIFQNTVPTTPTTTEITTPTYSTHGPKRVKTREMEIESHNPRDIQRVIERDTYTTLPTFSSGAACVGRFKCEDR